LVGLVDHRMDDVLSLAPLLELLEMLLVLYHFRIFRSGNYLFVNRYHFLVES
jgi:hypothetical protein